MSANVEFPSVVIDAAILARASEWMALLWSENSTEHDHAGCRAWREAHSDHEQAWNRLQAINQKFGDVPRDVARQALLGPDASARFSRRGALKMLSVLATFGVAGHAVRRTDAWQLAAANQSSAVGEIRPIVLADGSRVVLDTASAIDLAFTDVERRILLRAGQILIETAHEPATHRPLLVETEQGTVHALGTRFMVRHDEGVSHVAVYHGAVEVQPTRAGSISQRLDGGQRTVFSESEVQPALEVNETDAAWTQGRLVAERMRVADLIATLARYRTGILRCAPGVANLRVTGVFPLRDTDRALRNLARGVPVEVTYRSRWWVTVQARQPDVK